MCLGHVGMCLGPHLRSSPHATKDRSVTAFLGYRGDLGSHQGHTFDPCPATPPTVRSLVWCAPWGPHFGLGPCLPGGHVPEGHVPGRPCAWEATPSISPHATKDRRCGPIPSVRQRQSERRHPCRRGPAASRAAGFVPTAQRCRRGTPARHAGKDAGAAKLLASGSSHRL
jgi:hypothetical protein